MGTLVLHTGAEPEFYENAERVSLSDLKIRTPDALLLQYIMIRSCENKARVYTVDELWPVGWSAVDRAGKTPKQATDSVQGAMSRLRQSFPGTLPVKGDGGWKLLKPVLDHTPVDPPLLVAHRIFIGCVITAMGVVTVDTPTRAILAGLKVTVVQTTRRTWAVEAIIGAFQGICGSVLYGVPIAFGLFYLWFKIFDHDPWKTKHPRCLAAIVGGGAGFLAGAAISGILVGVQHPETLYEASWTVASIPANVWTDVHDAWFVTHVAWTMPWFGLWVGAAVAIALMQIVSDHGWEAFLADSTAITDPRIGLNVLMSLFKTALPASLRYVFPALLAAAALFCLVPNDPVSRSRIFGESIVIAMGGLGLIMGFLTSLYSLTKGADIAGDRKCSLTQDTHQSPNHSGD